MEEKVKAIVIGSKDYKEKDKQIVLFSLEYGKIYVTLRGVKSFKAKLKMAKEPFCFADFVLTNSFSGSIVTSFEPIDTLFKITEEPNRYFAGCTILDLLNTIVMPKEPNPALFVETLKALKALAYDTSNEKYVLCKFLISVFEGLGYKLSLNKCAICGEQFIGKHFLCLESGEVTCLSCKMPNSVEISPASHAGMKVLSNTDYDKLKTIKLAFGTEDEILKLLSINFENRFNKKLKTF